MVETTASFGGAPVDPSVPPGQGIRCYIQMADDDGLHHWFRLAVRHRATVIPEPADRFYGDRSFTILDPDGYRISLSQPTGRSACGSHVVLAGNEAAGVIR